MRKYALGVQAAAKAAGCSKTYISLIAAGKRTTTNTLIKRAIDKYVTVIEIPEIDAEKELENLARRLK
ncbi:MAG: hypothetical protein II332_06835 [Kiritimatiellae bacterium]|nr:hypothetical protein [Kiritimatiellia bacterium]